uniref:Pericentrin/AKAP-450 centrosomal targeting domain-containing protein n=1 Tax=Magallana gigas TaxID=29159 RepID=A0A8W8M7J4_MAGGI
MARFIKDAPEAAAPSPSLCSLHVLDRSDECKWLMLVRCLRQEAYHAYPLFIRISHQPSSGVEDSVNVQSLEKSLKDLLSELKQTQTPLRQTGAEQQIQRLYGKYLRADSYRKALVYQKKYLLLLLGGFQDCEQTTLALIARMGVYPSPEDLQRGTRPRRPVTAFRSVARVVVAVTRSVGQTGHRVQECLLIGSVVVVQPGYLFVFDFPGEMYFNEYSGGHAPTSNSFSPPCINTKSHLNSSGPFNSHASLPLHSSVHQSPYSPSYLSSSFTQRHLHNGTSPYHSLGGPSSGNHVNSTGVTIGFSSYQSVGGVMIVTMSTVISLSIPHRPRGTTAANHTPLLKTQVLQDKLSPLLLPTKVETQWDGFWYSKVKVISTEIAVRSRDIVKSLLSL